MQVDDFNSPFRIVNVGGSAPILILCDHAANAIPPELGDLGLCAYQRHQHIAWDIGAKAFSEILSWRFGAPLIAARWSRLVVDLNRYPDDVSLAPAVSDGISIPANLGLSETDRAARVGRYHTPYHACVTDMLDTMIERHGTPLVLLVHTFTPEMNGVHRPWELGVLYEQGRELADEVIAAFGADPGFTIGRNEPYSAAEPRGYTMFHHLVERQLPYLCIEVRQDLLADAHGVRTWADRLGPTINNTLLAYFHRKRETA